MCLGVPGKIIEIQEDALGLNMGRPYLARHLFRAIAGAKDTDSWSALVESFRPAHDGDTNGWSSQEST